MKGVNAEMANEVSAINEKVTLLNSIKEHNESNVTPIFHEIMNSVETVKRISDNLQHHMSGMRTYRYTESKENWGLEEMLRQNVTLKEMVFR